MEFKVNAVNQVPKGTIFLNANKPVTYICTVLKGRICLHGDGIRCVMGTASFLGIPDIYGGHYLCDYEALDDASVYVFPVSGIEIIAKIVTMNKDYSGLMISSSCRQVTLANTARNQLLECADKLHKFTSEVYERYVKNAKALSVSITPNTYITGLQGMDEASTTDDDMLKYYLECAKIPIETQKTYYSYLNNVTLRHLREMAELIKQLINDSRNAADYIKDASDRLVNDSQSCLYREMTKLAIDLKKQGKNPLELPELLDSILDNFNKADKLLEECVGITISVDREKMEELYAAMLSGDTSNMKEEIEAEQQKVEEDALIERDVKSLKDSLSQIIRYSGLDKETADKFTALINYLRDASDRSSTEDTMRRVKKEIAVNFYKIYYMVFLKARNDKDVPKAVRLFLDYGYMDENLLEAEQLRCLCSFKPEVSEGPCKIYTMCEWLEKVYRIEKDTSKSEFDENYAEALRNDRKKNAITEKEEAEYIKNGEKCLEFEINNLFTVTNRLTNAQLSIFAPVLYKEMFASAMDKSKLYKKHINQIVKRLLDIDYSAFNCELIYSNPEIGITKEFIIKTIYPNIILTPMVGQQSIMWQETSNKRKDTPARFIFPTFLEGNILDHMVRTFGRFRWEICRFIQGTSWNDVTEKSLTSEYCDYLQFYRKNHDLSEERKEKLKLQIQKARNNSREVFAQDYELWIKSESMGAIQLNKITREILATYCPFSLPIREKLAGQPIFDEAMARFKREKIKKIKETETRYRALEREKVVLPKELVDTLELHKNT